MNEIVQSRNAFMNTDTLEQLAGEIGLNYVSSQTTLIREIQKHRGEEACFLTDQRYGCRKECEWSSGCRKLRAVWLR